MFSNFACFSGILTINRVERLDSGTYICEANNNIGQPQLKTIFVNVEGNTAYIIVGSLKSPQTIHCSESSTSSSFIIRFRSEIVCMFIYLIGVICCIDGN